MPRPTLRHWILLGLLVASLGSSFLLLKITLTRMQPSTATLGRMVIGFLILAPYAFFLRLRLPTSPHVWKEQAFIAALGAALPSNLLAWGQRAVPSGVAGILMSIMPITIIGLAHLLLPDEKLTRNKLGGFMLAFGGTLALIGPSALLSFGGDGRMLVHELAILAAALCYAANAVLLRRITPIHPVLSTALVLLIAALILAPFSGAQAITDLRTAPPAALLALLLGGAVSTAFSTLLFFILVREAGASFFAIAQYLSPIWATLLGVCVGRETLEPSAIVALVLILCGVAIAQRRPAPNREQA